MKQSRIVKTIKQRRLLTKVGGNQARGAAERHVHPPPRTLHQQPLVHERQGSVGGFKRQACRMHRYIYGVMYSINLWLNERYIPTHVYLYRGYTYIYIHIRYKYTVYIRKYSTGLYRYYTAVYIRTYTADEREPRGAKTGIRPSTLNPCRGTSLIRNTHPPRITVGP